MIPKIIHSFWFSGNKLGELQSKCIKSWPYEYHIWGNDYIPSESVEEYFCQAIALEQWAFASDVARLDVLDKYGGIYLDCDVEVYAAFDHLLEYEFFTGHEHARGGKFLSTPYILGANQSAIIKDLLRQYETPFVNHGKETNTLKMHRYFSFLENDNKTKIFNRSIMLSSDELGRYFKHHFDGSWIKNNIIFMK